jgi:hypothetical protein
MWLPCTNDPKMGLSIGSKELKAAEMARISIQNAVGIHNAVLDAVFDSQRWGTSITMPDKVGNIHGISKPNPVEVDLGAL